MDSFPPGPRAVLFDLDGTLTETELLKARSYAHVVRNLHNCDAEVELLDHRTMPHPDHYEALANVYAKPDPPCNQDTPSQEAFDRAMKIFMDNIGNTSERVCRAMIADMNLTEKLKPAMQRFGVDEPWKALYKLRKEEYYTTFATVEALRSAQYPHNVANLKLAAKAGLPVAVVTSSSTTDAERVLDALDVRHLLQFVIGADQVANPKPDPEPYTTAAAKLGLAPQQILVFEDSLNGLKAAVGAGTNVVAVANPFTRKALQKQTLLAQDRVAAEVGDIDSTVRQTCATMVNT